MRHLMCVVLLAVAAPGCNDPKSPSAPAYAPPGSTAGDARPSDSVPVQDRDNTVINERDRQDNAKTPIDQNENQRDIDITAKIRKRVVDTKMSTDAHNVKIITQDGKVTLRGPVASPDEKANIEKIAREVAGDDNVVSQLEVAIVE